jgi:hypothetical protein
MKKSAIAKEESEKFQNSVADSFNKSLKTLLDLNSSSRNILNDLKGISSKTISLIDFANQQSYPIYPLSIRLNYTLVLPSDRVTKKAPLLLEALEKTGNTLNLTVSDIEKLDFKSRSFLINYVSVISFDNFLALDKNNWLKMQENHSWINLTQGKHSVFNTYISGRSNSSLTITVQCQIDSLKINNAGFLKINGLKDLINKYLVCSFEENELQFIQYIKIEFLSGVSLIQQFGFQLDSRNIALDRPMSFYTIIKKSDFDKKYEGP